MELFKDLPTISSVEVVNNEHAFGFVVHFMEQGFGFGEITFSVRKDTGEVRFDNEEMSMEHCGLIVERLIGTRVLGPDHE